MIPFPQMHIAESVLNRVFNALEGNEATLGLQMPAMPDVPDAKVLGSEIDAAVKQPALPAAVPPQQTQQANQAMVTESAMGGSPFDAALVAGSQV